MSGPDGSRLELDIAGYQYAEGIESSLPEYDLNWLIVRIRARTPKGWEWVATDPCLLTWELEELARWLEVHSYDDKAFPKLDFVEPCLAFDIRHPDRNSDAASLQIQLSCELSPPFPEGSRIADMVLRFEVRDEGLAASALDCRALCSRFPRRPAAPAREGNA